MSFTEEPGQAAPPPMPPMPSMPPEPSRSSGSALFGAVPPASFSLGTAIEGAFRSLSKPAFILPILVLSVIVNAILELTITPIISKSISVSPTGRPTIEDLNALLGAAGVSFVIALIGGIIVSVYGTVWAVTASVGPGPTVGETLRLGGRRWIGIIGTGILVGLIVVAAMLVALVVLGVLAQISQAIAFGVAIGAIIVFVYVVARLGLATWLAADGVGVMDSVQGSWRITEGAVLRIIGWSIAYGLLFALVAAALGAVLGRVPYVGAGIAQGITLALGYGAGSALYRRTQAGAPPTAAVSAPPVSGTTIG